MEIPSQGRIAKTRMQSAGRLFRKTRGDATNQLLAIERFDQIIKSAHPQRFYGGIHGRKSGHEDDLGAWRVLLDGLAEFKAIEAPLGIR